MMEFEWWGPGGSPTPRLMVASYGLVLTGTKIHPGSGVRIGAADDRRYVAIAPDGDGPFRARRAGRSETQLRINAKAVARSLGVGGPYEGEWDGQQYVFDRGEEMIE